MFCIVLLPLDFRGSKGPKIISTRNARVRQWYRLPPLETGLQGSSRVGPLWVTQSIEPQDRRSPLGRMTIADHSVAQSESFKTWVDLRQTVQHHGDTRVPRKVCVSDSPSISRVRAKVQSIQRRLPKFTLTFVADTYCIVREFRRILPMFVYTSKLTCFYEPGKGRVHSKQFCCGLILAKLSSARGHMLFVFQVRTASREGG